MGDRVTIFGESAGGMSVHAQILSAVNQGKLAGGIAQSGTLLAYQMERLPPRRVQATAREVSSKLGCGGQLTKATLSCLQDVPIERLMEVTSSSDPTADDQPSWGSVAGGGGMLELIAEDQDMKLKGREERLLLWDRLVWGPRQELIERKIIYEKANEFFQSSNLA